MSTWVFQVFIFRDGQFLGTEMVSADVFDIGRDASVAVRLEDEAASRRHCRIGAQPDGQLVLQDLGSANGTFLNNQRVNGTAYVTQRDDIRIGRHTFKLKVLTQGNVSAPAPAGFQAPAHTAVVGGGAEAGAHAACEDNTEVELALPAFRPAAAAPAPQAPPPMPPMSDPTVESPLPPAAARPVPPPAAAPAPAAAPRAASVPPPPAAAPPAPAFAAPHAAAQPAAPPAATHAATHAAAHADAHAFAGAHLDDEDEEHDHDDEPHHDYSLVKHLGDETRLQGSRVVAEVMAVEGDSLSDYVAVPRGSRHRVSIPSPDGASGRKSLQHALVDHKKTGPELSLAAGMTARLVRKGAVQELAPASTTPMAAGDVALVNWNNHGFMVRVAPAPAALSEVARESLAEVAQRRQDLRTVGLSGGGSLLAHALLFGVFFVASLLSPPTRVTQLEDEFAEVKVQEVELEEPPEPEKPPEPVPEPPPPPPEQKPQPQPKMAKTRPTGKQPPSAAPEVSNPKPGILAALTKLPQGKANAGSQTLLAAVSNINAVKVPGGQAGFKVSALIGKGPSNSVQIGGSGGGVATKGLNSILREGGAGVLGGKEKGTVRAAPAMAMHRQAKLTGELSREEIAKVINQHMGEIQFCYERELLKTPSLQGKVVFEWTIKTDGTVLQVRTKVGDLASPAAQNCMIDKIKGWVFPKPRGNGVVVVTYPFIFKQAGF